VVEAEIASSKFAAPDAAAALPEEGFALPRSYGRTRVRVLMQSPGRLYVHWDLSPAVLEDLKAQLGRRAASLARLAIRIHTPESERALLVLLPRGAQSWYVDVPAQRLEYRVELGLVLPSGEFRSIAQGNVLRTPRTTPSPVPAERRVAVEREEAPRPEDIGALPPEEPARPEDVPAAEPVFAGGIIDAEETSPGGSSELSGGRPRRGRTARGQGERAAGALGGASDLAPPGASSDLRPRQ
jgi:hypothetical protein